jgi:site-specific DNA-methyltransferase (adenine-specific)
MSETIHADCIEVMSVLADKSVTMAITDIPYGVVSRPSSGIRVFDKSFGDTETFKLQDFCQQLCRVVSGSVYVFCSTEQVSLLRTLLIDHGMTTRLCIWEKNNPSPVNGQSLWLSGVECCVFGRYPKATFNEHCKNTVFRFPIGSSKIHPTQKPVALFERLILASSNEGDLVLDPCCGSGTTGVACTKLNRQFIQADINPDCVAMAQKRLESL